MKLTALLSGGIDSPVAAYMMCRAGADVTLLHMDNTPYSDERELEKVRKLAHRLREVTGQPLPLYSAPHGPNQGIVSEKCVRNYQCVICKRLMMHVAKGFSLGIGSEGIIMGDSLGQVASQTLRNMRGEESGLDFPIIRPLIGLDKEEIIGIAKKIGTYDISIMKSSGCSIVPDRPAIEASPETVGAQISRLDFPAMVAESVSAASICKP